MLTQEAKKAWHTQGVVGFQVGVEVGVQGGGKEGGGRSHLQEGVRRLPYILGLRSELVPSHRAWSNPSCNGWVESPQEESGMRRPKWGLYRQWLCILGRCLCGVEGNLRSKGAWEDRCKITEEPMVSTVHWQGKGKSLRICLSQ